MLDDKSIKNDKKAIFEHIGYIPSNAASAILGETAEDDVALSLILAKKEKKKNALLKARDIINTFANSDFSKHDVLTLSSGEEKIVSICSQVILDKDILLFDEPFNFLDYKATIMLIDLLLKLKESGKTILIVSHELDKFLSICDNMIILKNGEVKHTGAPESLLDRLNENNIHRPFGDFRNMRWR